MTHQGIYAIPRTGTLGVSVFYTFNGETKWLMDVMQGIEVLKTHVDLFKVYDAGDDEVKEIVSIAANTTSGLVTVLVHIDDLYEYSTEVMGYANDVVIQCSEEPHDSANGCTAITLYDMDLSYTAAQELIFRAYYRVPSSPYDEFWVQTYRCADGEEELTLSAVESGQVELGDIQVALVDDEGAVTYQFLDAASTEVEDTEIRFVGTIPKRFTEATGTVVRADIPVVITDLGIYFVTRLYDSDDTFLFSGFATESYFQEQEYTSSHFSPDGVPEVIKVFSQALHGVYFSITPQGIFSIHEDPISGEVHIKLTSVITLDSYVGCSSGEVLDQFEAIARCTTATTTSPYITSERIASIGLGVGGVSLVSQVGSNLYIRVSHRLISVSIAAGELTVRQDHLFDRARFSPVSFAIGMDGNIIEVKETGLFDHKSISETVPEVVPVESDILGYSIGHRYTETVLDADAVEKEHPILIGTVMDNISNESVETINTIGLDGAYSSRFGHVFLSSSSTGTTSVFSTSGSGEITRTTTLSTIGSIVSGVDVSTHSVERTIILFKDDLDAFRLYCIEYGSEIRVQQALLVGADLVGGLSALQGSKDCIYLQTLDGVYSLEVASFGVVIDGSNNTNILGDPVVPATNTEVTESGPIHYAYAYYDYKGRQLLTVAAGTRLLTYSIITEGERTSILKSVESGLESIQDVAVLSADQRSTMIIAGSIASSQRLTTFDFTSPGDLGLVNSIEFSDASTVVSFSGNSILASTTLGVQVYRKNSTLTLGDWIPGTSIVSNAVAVLGQYVLVPTPDSTKIYRWWTGVSSEVYYDEEVSTRHVPMFSVDYDVQPTYYTRQVIERESTYNEPVTVAFETTSPSRSRQVVSNKRLSFRESILNTGQVRLVPSDNSRKLLRNSTLWCLEVNPNTLVINDDTIVEEAQYEYSELKTDNINTLSMTANPVCGNINHIDQILESIPTSGVVIQSKYLPAGVEEDVFFENDVVSVYSREVPGTPQLRVEFGEYRHPNTVSSGLYETPGYSGGETGLISSGGIYRFWDMLWDQSNESGSYLSELLDARKSAVGPAKKNDLVKYVNPARLLLSHFLANSVITIIRVSPALLSDQPVEDSVIDEDGDETLTIGPVYQSMENAVIEAAEDMDKMPWLQINKTLPASSKCVTVYVVDSNTSLPVTVETPEI